MFADDFQRRLAANRFTGPRAARFGHQTMPLGSLRHLPEW
jgi:hypothetical protein